jgi:hypothetical protein
MMGFSGAKLKIEQPGLGPHTTRVWLDDREITSVLQGLTVEWGPDRVTSATITIGISELECGAQTLVNLIAQSQDPVLLENAIRTLKRAKAELT